jgi:hypothetical protein
METNYMIFNISELTNIDFNEVLETSPDTIRTSADDQKTFVQWTGNIPNCVESLTTKEGPYTYSKMLEILNGKDWFKIVNFLS